MSGFLAALGLLTRIPSAAPVGNEALRGAIGWLPTVGLLIGLVGGGAYGLAYGWMPSLLAAVIAVGVGVLVTGALHEDGLADAADALGAGAVGERAVEIMRDPRLGTYGTLALVFSVLWRVLVVAPLMPGVAVAGLAAAHTLSRAGVVGLMASAPPAVGDGLGHAGMSKVGPTGTSVAIGSGLAITTLALGCWVVPAALLVTMVVAVVGLLARRRIGGVTGDVLGAAQQLSEMAILGVVAVAVWRGATLWWQPLL